MIENDAETALSVLIGARVAAQRAARGLSMEGLAELTAVSRAMISKIERGEVHASAVVLDKLCSGLGLSLSALFAREATSPVTRRAEQPQWQDPETGYVRREVAPLIAGAAARIIEVDFPAGGEITFERGKQHGIAQYVWMLKGEMEISVGGVTHRLMTGDCLYMKTIGNSFRNRSGKPARYAVFITAVPDA